MKLFDEEYTKTELAQAIGALVITVLWIAGTIGGLHHLCMVYGWVK